MRANRPWLSTICATNLTTEPIDRLDSRCPRASAVVKFHPGCYALR